MEAVEQSESSRCQHCGLPLPADASRGFDASRFCCRGCEAVYSLIHSCGLERFYSHKDRLGATLAPVSDRAGTFEHFNDPLFIERHCRGPVESTEITWYVDRIHCAACIWLLERLPGIAPGVIRADPSLADSTLTIRFDRRETELSGIAQSISQLGYHPSPLDEREGIHRAADRRFLLRLGVAGFCAGNTMLLAVAMYQGSFSGIEESFRSVFRWTSMVLALPAVLYSAGPFYRAALGGLRAGMVHIDLPISLGILVGFLASLIATVTGREHIYYDSVCALIFFLLAGRWLQHRLVARARQKIRQNQYLPGEVRIEENGIIRSQFAERVRPGDVVCVDKGEIIPCDGMLLTSGTLVNNAHITGESRPIPVGENEPLLAGSTNQGNSLRMQVTAVGPDTRIGKVLELAERSSAMQVPYREVTERLSKAFVIVVLFLCAVTFVLWYPAGVDTAVANAIALLVVSCPCALGLSAPLATAVAVSRAMQQGIFIRRGDFFERLLSITHCVFDKTGTLTRGECTVHECTVYSTDENLWRYVLHLERETIHPVGAALRQYARQRSEPTADDDEWTAVEEQNGAGVLGQTGDGRTIQIGKIAWLLSSGHDLGPEQEAFLTYTREKGYTPVGLAIDGTIAALFSVGDTLHPGMIAVLESVQAGCRKVSVLSGDEQQVVDYLSGHFAGEFFCARGGVSPEEKAALIREFKKEDTVLMVGDGINDVLALSAADASIAVRGQVESCLQVADAFVPSGRPDLLSHCFAGSRETMAVIRQNIILSLVYNGVGALMAMAGLLTPLIAAIVMPLSSFSVIVSSARNRAFRL